MVCTPLTPKNLRDIIKNAIDANIGEYVYRDGRDNRDAIATGNPPNDARVTGGVEIIISIMGDTTSNRGGFSINSDEFWDIIIVDHINNPTNFYEAIRGLQNIFSRSRGQNVPQSSVTDNLPMYILTIRYGRSYDL